MRLLGLVKIPKEPFIQDTSYIKQVLPQTMNTQMECRIWRHFIRVFSGCFDKNYSNYDWQPLKSQNGDQIEMVGTRLFFFYLGSYHTQSTFFRAPYSRDLFMRNSQS